MYKKAIPLLFLLIISTMCFSWEMIYIHINGQPITAWIPQSELEVDAAYQANAQVIPYGNDQCVFGVAYIFPGENWFPENYAPNLQFNGQDSIIQPNAFNSGGDLLTLTPPISLGLQTGGSGLLKFKADIYEQVKYCKEFAYSAYGCQRKTCKHVHIVKKDFKKRVVCFRQIIGNCHSGKCHHRHLLQHQLTQLQSVREAGMSVPIIVCAEDHKTRQEVEKCPYIHFNSN